MRTVQFPCRPETVVAVEDKIVVLDLLKGDRRQIFPLFHGSNDGFEPFIDRM
jgi:hypothetical protein